MALEAPLASSAAAHNVMVAPLLGMGWSVHTIWECDIDRGIERFLHQ